MLVDRFGSNLRHLTAQRLPWYRVHRDRRAGTRLNEQHVDLVYYPIHFDHGRVHHLKYRRGPVHLVALLDVEQRDQTVPWRHNNGIFEALHRRLKRSGRGGHVGRTQAHVKGVRAGQQLCEVRHRAVQKR